MCSLVAGLQEDIHDQLGASGKAGVTRRVSFLPFGRVQHSLIQTVVYSRCSSLIGPPELQTVPSPQWHDTHFLQTTFASLPVDMAHHLNHAETTGKAINILSSGRVTRAQRLPTRRPCSSFRQEFSIGDATQASPSTRRNQLRFRSSSIAIGFRWGKSFVNLSNA